jgi:hypothetical protein
MTHQESSGRIASLMEQLAEMTRQRDDLSRTLSSIEGTVHAHREAEKVTAGSAPSPDDRDEPVQPSWSEPQGKPTDDSFLPTDDAAMDLLTPGPVIDLTPLSPGTFGLPSADFLDSMTPQAASSLQQQAYLDMDSIGSPSLIVPEPDKPCDCVSSAAPAGPPTASGSIWRTANEALSGPGLLSNHTLRYEDELSEDIPVRVVLEGWDAVERSQNMPPLWRKLRRTDELQFSKCGKTERLAILRLMHTLLRYQAEPTAEQYAKLPPWYLSR